MSIRVITVSNEKVVEVTAVQPDLVRTYTKAKLEHDKANCEIAIAENTAELDDINSWLAELKK